MNAPYYNNQFGNSQYNQPMSQYNYQPNNYNNQFNSQQYTPLRPNYVVSTLPGRLINDISEVLPNEVPMDGTVSIFPLKDFSAIFVKVWTSNGVIDTYKFVMEKTNNESTIQPSSGNDVKEFIQNGFNRLEELIIGKEVQNNE